MRRNPLARPQDAALWAALQAHDEAGVRQALLQRANPALRVPQLGTNDQPALSVLAANHLDRVGTWAQWGLDVPAAVWVKAVRQLPREDLGAVLQGPQGRALLRASGALKAWWHRALRQPAQTRAWLTLWCEGARMHRQDPWEVDDLIEVCAYRSMNLPLWDLALSHLRRPSAEATAWGWQRAWERGNLRLAQAMAKRPDFDPERAAAVFRGLLSSHAPDDLGPASCAALLDALTTPASQAAAMAGLADLPSQVAAWSPLCSERGWWGAAEAHATYRTVLRYPDSAAYQLTQHRTLDLLLRQGLDPWQQGGLLPVVQALTLCVDREDLLPRHEIAHGDWWDRIVSHRSRPALAPWREAVESMLAELEDVIPEWVQTRRQQIQTLARAEHLEVRPPAQSRPVRRRA